MVGSMRAIHRFIGGSFVLLALAGCGGSWFAQREPWRREAEEACLKSGVVREGPAVALLRPIEGPGICGADFPLKVAAIGEGNPLGYADEVRPPGSVPHPGNPLASPSYSPARSAPAYAPPPPDTYGSRPATRIAPAEDPYRYRGPQGQAASAPPPPIAPGRAAITQPVSAALSPTATLACPIVSVLDRWVTDGVQPAARRWFGSAVVEIKQISAYSCRGMNGQMGAPISEHSFGNALDIAAFKLADGRTITVRDGWRGMPEEQGFLRDVEAAACEHFTTVLAPGSNAFHYDHMHVDLMRHASGSRICNPQAVSGEEVAARAQARLAQRGYYPSRQRVSSADGRRDPVGDEYYESREFTQQRARY
jgi:hypothetical protein